MFWLTPKSLGIWFTLNLKIENALIPRYKLTPAAVAYYVKYSNDFGWEQKHAEVLLVLEPIEGSLPDSEEGLWLAGSLSKIRSEAGAAARYRERDGRPRSSTQQSREVTTGSRSWVGFPSLSAPSWRVSGRIVIIGTRQGNRPWL